MSYFELGGFAEDETDIDGDFNAFNYCLADQYWSAIVEEDFEALGEIKNGLIDNIVYWLNYDGKIGKNDLKAIKGIDNGSIITIKKRTFIEAIIDCHNYQLAKTYILRGIHNIDLFLTHIIYAPIDEIDGYILSGSYMFENDRDKYVAFLNKIFSGLDDYYKKIEDKEEQIQFLNRIKTISSLVRYPREYGQIKISKDNYSFGRQLTK